MVITQHAANRRRMSGACRAAGGALGVVFDITALSGLEA
jgi:hypothetical protein